MQERLNVILEESKAQLANATSLQEADETRVKVLGKKGALTEILKSMGKLSPEERKELGQAANQVRAEIEELLKETFDTLKSAAQEAKLKAEKIDVTEPGKKVTAGVKLQLAAGKATPGPPVGSTLGPYGINIPGFTKEFNAKTANDVGLIIPVVITIYQDRSFTFILKTPPAPVLIKKACGLQSASAKPNKDKVAKLTKAQVEEIAKQKMPDLNAASLEAAMSMIKGTARSMGITVEE